MNATWVTAVITLFILFVPSMAPAQDKVECKYEFNISETGNFFPNQVDSSVMKTLLKAVHKLPELVDLKDSKIIFAKRDNDNFLGSEYFMFIYDEMNKQAYVGHMKYVTDSFFGNLEKGDGIKLYDRSVIENYTYCSLAGKTQGKNNNINFTLLDHIVRQNRLFLDIYSIKNVYIDGTSIQDLIFENLKLL